MGGMLKKIKSRGQVLVFYAVMIPTLLVFVGAGLDLGWYYLTVSRMQNAADAAVMAGAWKMLEDEEAMSDYVHPGLIDFVPNYILEDPEMISTRDKTNGDTVAKAYVKHNLSPEDAEWDGDTIIDAYDIRSNKLTFSSNLYGRGKEYTGEQEDNDDYDYRHWYQVILEEDVKHFFLSGWFAPMKAKVQSVARFSHYIKGPNLFEMTLAVAESETYESWDHIKMVNDSNDDADNRSVLSNGNKYRIGDKHRIEVLAATAAQAAAQEILTRRAAM